MDILLTPHFNTREFYRTDRLAYKKAQKEMYFSDPSFLTRSFYMAYFLEGVRKFVGEPIRINSAFRVASLNNAVGGVSRSRHLHCLAVDITCNNLDKLKCYFERYQGFSTVLCEVVFHKTYIHLGFYNPALQNEYKPYKIKYWDINEKSTI